MAKPNILVKKVLCIMDFSIHELLQLSETELLPRIIVVSWIIWSTKLNRKKPFTERGSRKVILDDNVRCCSLYSAFLLRLVLPACGVFTRLRIITYSHRYNILQLDIFRNMAEIQKPIDNFIVSKPISFFHKRIRNFFGRISSLSRERDGKK